MTSANSFVKSELQETLVAYTPVDGVYNVLDPCHRCSTTRSVTAKPWEYCMRQRRSCLRKNEEHDLPTIRRVHVSELSEDTDFACVFENDGGDTITWDKRTTRCRVPCDKCWSLEQCTRMNHTLDPHDIPFIDIDDAPGVTPAKRSCKSSSPLSYANTPSSGGRDPKQARRSPASNPGTGSQADAGSSPPELLAAPIPLPRPPAMPAVPAVETAVTPHSSPSSTGGERANGGGGGGNSGGSSGGSSGDSPRSESAAAKAGGGGDKGKRPARRQSGGAGGETGGVGVGDDPRSPSPDAAAGTGAGSEAEGAGEGGAGARGAGAVVHSLKSPATGRGSDVYIERLRERLQLVESESQKAVDHLSELDKVKLHANAKIRDGERLLKSSKLKEKEVQKLLDASKSKEAELTNQLKEALTATAQKLKQQAAQLEQEAQQLFS